MKRVLIISMITLILGACSTSNAVNPSDQPELQLQTPEASAYPYPPSNLPEEQPAYPAPSQVVDANAYPMPTADYSTLIVEVTPDQTMGQVAAEILLKGKPLPSQMFFLADVLVDSKTGMELATSLDRSAAPRAFSDEQGLLNFQNVPPGRYGLILMSGTDTYLLIYPGKEEAILLTVEAGDSIDLGTLDFDELPID